MVSDVCLVFGLRNYGLELQGRTMERKKLQCSGLGKFPQRELQQTASRKTGLGQQLGWKAGCLHPEVIFHFSVGVLSAELTLLITRVSLREGLVLQGAGGPLAQL